MNVLDFSMAKLAHQQWKFRLRSYLDGLEQMNLSEAVSHQDCEFGKWLYGKGQSEMADFAEMNQLERSHATMHAEVKKTIESKSDGNNEMAETHYSEVVRLSNEVVGLMDQIMAKM